ncbi:MAG: PAS domain S-box protein [Candidatus Nanoarchaeia archaeon]|nr:PAS domain S-box protein [Candidatus Nanoarchaeia archaeon]
MIEKKNIELGLILKDDDYKTLFKNNSQAMIIHNLKGEIIDINESTGKMLGYSKDEIKKIKIENIIKKEFGVKFNIINLLKKTVEKGCLKLKFEFLKKDNSSFLGEVDARAIILSNGLNVLMLIDNITEQKILQENIQKEKDFSQKIIFSAPNIIVGLGINSEILIFNNFAEKLTGYKSSEVMGKKWIEVFIPKNERDEIYKVWAGVVLKKKEYYTHENIIVTKDGQKKNIKWNNTFINEKNEFRMILSIGEDVTEKNKIEKALKESEEKYKKIFDNAPEVMLLISPKGIILDVNNRLYEISGYNQKEIVGKSMFNLPFVDKANKELIKNKFIQRGKGIKIEPYVFEITNKKGEKMFFMLSGNPIFDDKKNLVKLYVTLSNITLLKKLQVELKESEEKFKELFNRMNDAAFIADVNTSILLDANIAAQNLTKRSKKELVGMHQCKLHADNDEGRRVFKKNVVSQVSNEVESNIISKDGKIIPVLITSSVIELKGKKFALGIFKDISRIKKSEEKYKSTLSSMSDLVFVFNKDAKFTYYHAPKNSLLYSDPEYFFGKKVSQVMPKFLVNMFDSAFEETKKGKISEFEYPLKIKGVDMYFYAKLSPIFINEEFNGCVAVVREITKLKKYENDLTESEEKFKTLFQSSPEAIIFLDLNGIIKEANEQACKVVGYDYNEIINKNILNLSLFSKKSKELVLVKLQERLKGKDNPPYELQFITKKGEARIGIIHGKIIKDFKGKILGDLVIIEDVTDRKKIENDLIESEKKFKKQFLYYKELDEIKNDFVNVFSHELKKPMIPIMNYSELLLNNYLGEIDDSQKKVILKIKKNAKKEINMISDILNIGKFEKNKIKLNYSKFSINNLIKEIIESKSNGYLEKDIKVIFKPFKEDIWINSDRINLSKIISNLFENALIFTNKGYVKILLKKEKDMLSISIKDTGIGISKDKFDKIFTKFYQIDSSISRSYEGTGIGLYTAKLITEMLKGKISFTSELNKGSTFTVKIPIN